MNEQISTLTAACAILLLRAGLGMGSDLAASTVSFRYSPPEWQTAICLPDDPHKSLVDRSGALLCHYRPGAREFATRLSVHVSEHAQWQSQTLHSPRVPMVRTQRRADGLEILEEAFAVTDLRQANRSDLILVHVANRGAEPRTLRPQIIVDTILPFTFQPESQQVHLSEDEVVTASLRMTGLAAEQEPQRVVQLAELPLAAGKSATFFVRYSASGATPVEPATVAQAMACRQAAVAFWETAPLPYGRVQVPDANIQALVDSSIRNIWQAREIKNGLPAFQVGPTCYRGLWIVDGAFLLEAATMLGAGDEARNGVVYELTFQQTDGRIQVMNNYSKENGIVLWTCIRHAQLTQDKAWLETLWPRLERIADYIKSLRRQTLTNHTALDDGLLPAGFPDGGIAGVIEEYTNPYWNLAGLRALIQGAHWLGKEETAAAWQSEYDDFMVAFRRAAQRDMRTNAAGHKYLPTRMDGQDSPQRGQWAFCHAVYPGQLFARNDPLVASMLTMLQDTEREGMVYGTGWDPTGLWNYFASFYGHACLWQGNGRKAAQVLTAFGDHAAPTLVWREEQSLQGEKFRKVGDMPHNWASAEFIRLVIHLLALDRGEELHLLEGLPPEWTGPGMNTRLNGVATPFGPLTMQLQVDEQGQSATLAVQPVAPNCNAVVVHLPDGSTARIPPQEGGQVRFRPSTPSGSPASTRLP